MRALALAAVVCVLSVGCGDDDGGDATDTITQLVGAEGGTVELVGGGKVTIPAGALNEAIPIKITKLDLNDIAALPDNMEPAGKPVAFEPHGQMFLVPVKIEVAYEGAEADNAETRPMKLPNEDAATSEWTTVFPNEKDVEEKTVGMETTSFSVILAARPNRTSGVVTLPDGAIETDGGVSGTGGSGGTGGTGGNDPDAGQDAGMDAAIGMTSCVGSPALVTTVDPAGQMVRHAMGFYVGSGGNLITEYTGSGTAPTSAGPVMTFDAPEVFDAASVSAEGSVLAVGTSRGGVSTTGRLHVARRNQQSGYDYSLYDLAAYQEYYTAAAPGGPFAFNPYFGPITTDGTTIFANERAAGSLLAFSAATGEPLGFLTTGVLDTSPLSGVVSMHVRNGVLVAAINRTGLGITAVNAIRTFDVSAPGDMTMADELVRTGSRPNAMIYDAPRDRYLVSNLAGAEISTFTIDASGNLSPETVLATVRTGSQARDMVVVGDFLAVGNPDFSVQPTDSAVSVFRIGSDGSLTFQELIDLPDVASSDESYSITTYGQDLYMSGSVTHVANFAACNPG